MNRMEEKAMIQERNIVNMRQQNGAVVLMVAILILFLTTILAFTTGKNVLNTSRLSNNDYNARQAFEAADAGLAYAEAFYKASSHVGNVGESESQLALANRTLSNPGTNLSQSAFDAAGETRFEYVAVNIGGSMVNSPVIVNDRTLLVRVRGVSADGLAEHVTQQYMSFYDVVPGAPGAPLTTQSTAGALGTATVENAFSNITVRAGGSATGGGAADTFICNSCAADDVVTYDPLGVSNDTDDGHLEERFDDGDVNIYENPGIDVIDFDSILSGATDDEFFQSFFDATKETIALVDEAVVLGDNPDITTNPDTGRPYSDALMVVNGDLHLNAGDMLGCNDANSDGHCEYSEIEPVAMVIFGDMQLNGHSQFYGLLYVVGEIKGNGTYDHVGAIAVESPVDINGTFSLRYHPDFASGPAGNIGATATATWRDWD